MTDLWWDDLPEWQQNYLRRLAPRRDLDAERYYGRPVDRWSWSRDQPIRYDFVTPAPTPQHHPATWAGAEAPCSWVDDALAWHIAQPTRRRRVRLWFRRRLWFTTRDGRQNRELRRLLDRYTAERGR